MSVERGDGPRHQFVDAASEPDAVDRDRPERRGAVRSVVVDGPIPRPKWTGVRVKPRSRTPWGARFHLSPTVQIRKSTGISLSKKGVQVRENPNSRMPIRRETRRPRFLGQDRGRHLVADFDAMDAIDAMDALDALESFR